MKRDDKKASTHATAKGENRRKDEGGNKKERDPEVHPSQPLTWQDLS